MGGSKLHASSETTTELSYKNIKNVSWTSEMSVGRQSKISKMSVGRQKCQLDVKKNIENVSWTSEMSVGRQKYYILEYGEDITSVSRARKGS